MRRTRNVWFVLAMGLAAASSWTAAGAATPPDVAVGDSLRMELCLNGIWEVAPGGDEMTMPATGWQAQRTPAFPVSDDGHPSALWYRRTLEVPQSWGRPGRRFFLELEKVGHYAAVLVNGRVVGECYGQFTPFEADMTGALRVDAENQLAVYVHDASGRYVRPGTTGIAPLVGASYRPGARGPSGRNWVGIVGDITFSWRPAEAVEDAFVVTSVREKRIEARLTLSALAGDGLTCRAAVLDGDRTVLELPEQPVAGRRLRLASPWAAPVLWGPPPYGEAKLYRLRTELARDGEVVDRQFTRFGFREVWVDGRDVMLNGRKLWMVGTYGIWLDPRRYVNDRRPMAAEIRAMQAGGLNTLNFHWDCPGRTYLDLCDEMGMLVHASFYCQSQLAFQPNADEGWADWTVSATEEWTRARRSHPCIVTWRPLCGLPKNLRELTDMREFRTRIEQAVRGQDGTRPIVNRSDVWDHNQGTTNSQTGDYDDGSGIAALLRNAPMPVLTVEIWGAYKDVEGVSGFFRAFYDKAYRGGSTGFIPQHLPFFEGVRFRPSWPSLSGPGNREADGRINSRCLNWCDPDRPACQPEPYGRLFADLHAEYTGRKVEVFRGRTAPELLASSLPADRPAFLVPEDPTVFAPVGLLAAPDGTAWFVVRHPGAYRLVSGADSKEVRVVPPGGDFAPGYDYIQRVEF